MIVVFKSIEKPPEPLDNISPGHSLSKTNETYTKFRNLKELMGGINSIGFNLRQIIFSFKTDSGHEVCTILNFYLIILFENFSIMKRLRKKTSIFIDYWLKYDSVMYESRLISFKSFLSIISSEFGIFNPTSFHFLFPSEKSCFIVQNILFQ